MSSNTAALSPSLYTSLERAVVAARETAEAGATAALQRLGLHLQPAEAAKLYGVQRDDDLSQRLRARKRVLGGDFDALAAECAYEYWHRMLFARTLAENHLLMHPDGVAVTLDDCAELAALEGASDGWTLAARYAARMLPQLFRPDDPTLQIMFAPEHKLALEALLKGLPAEVFTSDDGLGWMYQFWQSKRKEQVNKGGDKIGAGDLPAVTQLFTEDYMVRFLLENTLGAWATQLPFPSVGGAEGGVDSAFLRRLPDGQPAAGTFPGWPRRAAELRIIDPCCGSGHFLVAAFHWLVRLRMAEDGLSESEAADAVLRDNLFGLELDPRCAQIAAFALALAAWKRGGYRPLPPLNIACSGLAPHTSEKEWLALAGKNPNLRLGMQLLFDQFKHAETLGSLINPRRLQNVAVNFHDLRDLLGKALTPTTLREEGRGEGAEDGEEHELGVMAQGIARAAELLAGDYHLVCTNVPYLAFRKQDETLRDFCETAHPAAKADLATAFVERCLALCTEGGTAALVTPRNWLSLGSYKALREKLLDEETWNLIGLLGKGAFRMITGEVVNVALFAITKGRKDDLHELSGIDASAPRTPDEKAVLLREGDVKRVLQMSQHNNPDARFVLERHTNTELLEDYAISMRGIVAGDADRWVRCFWEVPSMSDRWRFYQSTVSKTEFYAGREHIIDWSTQGRGMLRPGTDNRAYGQRGIALGQMSLAATLYMGELYDNSTGAIVPRDETHIPAIWAFCSSQEYARSIRKVDQVIKVTNATLAKVPFDLDYWQGVADELYPNGLPGPHSDDPTQWLFRGDIAGSTAPLQVAVARLLGYRWPDQPLPAGEEAGDTTDADGIVCLPAVGGERPAHERLRVVLTAAFGEAWSSRTLDDLLTNAYGKANTKAAPKRVGTLEAWLRDDFFDQHCKIFHQRPFIWHVWDGRKDGFAALINYHKLDARLLERLTYTYLGDWIARQRAAARQDEAGAEERLRAALNLQEALKRIAQGEPPYDIYVRWKPLSQQPLGWQPDPNDGVRMNIRPYVTAGVLRKTPAIHWNKDRGKNPDGSERLNDLHFMLAEKRRAREGGTTNT